nr:MAG TPA: hypothetical protein [Caudoviricetes sp.]
MKHSSHEHQNKIHNLYLQAYASECMGLLYCHKLAGGEMWRNS